MLGRIFALFRNFLVAHAGALSDSFCSASHAPCGSQMWDGGPAPASLPLSAASRYHDFGNEPDATSISDRGLFRLLAGDLSPGVFRLLQHNLPLADIPAWLAALASRTNR
jgi:hypothetical protein